MEYDSSVLGVLNYRQFEKFCERFNLLPHQIKVNFDGWRKLVLYTEELVFMFPRDPRGIEWLEREAIAYEAMNDLDLLPVPKLVERVTDKEISYYDFIVVTRKEGEAFAKYEDELKEEDVRKLLLELAKVIPLWHNIDLEGIDTSLFIKPEETPNNITTQNWEKAILNPEQVREAILYIQGVIEYWGQRYNFQSLDTLISNDSLSKWLTILEEIANMNHVLVHADIHEDQILVESKETMNITGIIDWETVGIMNPIWDFNFYEWGLKIWEWKHLFSDFRRETWRTYLCERQLELSSLEGLDLFYSLSEFLVILKYPEKDIHVITGKNFENSIKYYLDKLNKITKKI
ncbi:MAG: aminoglycoside phosphotransferase family protein [Candidatus Heimdallarchaeota archaeon]|nr:aminoglycoside phosphotransferase family protein [Candidatus Heimdallarchaeota archaeon]